MKLLVVSHKPCWPSAASPSGYATDGGFPFQMRSLSELFDSTTVAVPACRLANHDGEAALSGHNLSIVALTAPRGVGFWRKLAMIYWVARNCATLVREIRRADGVHTPIPGDIGTIGMLLAVALQKPLFVRHCGNWRLQRTAAERFWRWFMERFAGGKNVMLATGGGRELPSPGNPRVRWIFSTSLTSLEIEESSRRSTRRARKAARLITVGRQEMGKGTELMIQALPIIVKDFPHATFDVVGDGGALAELKQLAAALGISDRVAFHGKVGHNRVIRLLREADLFCFPTSSEGFPKVVLEALACGLPVVTTKVSVLPLLIEGGCGVVLEERTPSAIARAVSACLSDRGLYEAMSAKAVATAKHYSLEHWRDTIGSYLENAWGPLKAVRTQIPGAAAIHLSASRAEEA